MQGDSTILPLLSWRHQHFYITQWKACQAKLYDGVTAENYVFLCALHLFDHFGASCPAISTQLEYSHVNVRILRSIILRDVDVYCVGSTPPIPLLASAKEIHAISIYPDARHANKLQ